VLSETRVITAMDSVRDLLDGAGATPDQSATWTAPERRGEAPRDTVVSYEDFARAISGLTEVTPSDVRLT
jgi:hypothetical protein